MAECEICGTALPKVRKPARETNDKSKPVAVAADRDSTKEDKKDNDTVRLSFRKGGEREAYKRLKGVLSDKVWERIAAPKPRVQRSGAGGIGERLTGLEGKN